MQVEDRVHARLANGVQMHHVAVIGQQVVVRARPEDMQRVGVVAADLEVESVAGERRAQAKRMVDIRGISRRFRVPPSVTAVDDQGGNGQGNDTRDQCPAARGWAGATPGSRRD